MQDAFQKLWERWDRIDRIADPKAYLFRVALNGSRMRARAARRAARRLARIAPSSDPFDEVSLREDVRQMLLDLSPRQRAALLLLDMYGYGSEQAARILGVRPSTSGRWPPRAAPCSEPQEVRMPELREVSGRPKTSASVRTSPAKIPPLVHFAAPHSSAAFDGYATAKNGTLPSETHPGGTTRLESEGLERVVVGEGGGDREPDHLDVERTAEDEQANPECAAGLLDLRRHEFHLLSPLPRRPHARGPRSMRSMGLRERHAPLA